MFAAGIALESVMKLFYKGTASQNLCKHTDGRFNEQNTYFSRLYYAGQTTLSG